MRCPYCNYEDTKVIDSRDAPDGVRRRRECIRCSLRFTTYERIQTTVLSVSKRDGRIEEYSRNKLTSSIQKACIKRPLPMGAIDKLVDDVESSIQAIGKSEMLSASIGEIVMEKLRTMDPVAYIRFASVYRDFADVESFREAVDALEKAKQTNKNNTSVAPQLSLIKDEHEVSKKRMRKPGPVPGLTMDI